MALCVSRGAADVFAGFTKLWWYAWIAVGVGVSNRMDVHLSCVSDGGVEVRLDRWLRYLPNSVGPTTVVPTYLRDPWSGWVQP